MDKAKYLECIEDFFNVRPENLAEWENEFDTFVKPDENIDMQTFKRKK